MSLLLTCCGLPCWPMGPFIGVRMLGGILAIAGVIFSVIMLIDCLKRPREKFVHQLTRESEYDKLIWAGAIVASLSFYFIGAIVYFFVVKRGPSASS